MKPRHVLITCAVSLVFILSGVPGGMSLPAADRFPGDRSWASAENSIEIYAPDQAFPRPRPATTPETLPVPREGCLTLSVEEAVFLALKNNLSLRVQLFSPLIAGTFEKQERAVFDTALFAEASLAGDKTETIDPVSGAAVGRREQSEYYRLGIGRSLATGTDIDLSLRQSRTDPATSREDRTAGVALSLTQALLRGAGRKANLAGVRQAALDTRASHYEVLGFTQALVAEIETTYWDFVLAEQRVLIYREALRVAQKQVEDIERRIEAGSLAETELAAARAELASRRQGLIDARSRREQTRLSLLRLINPGGSEAWSLDLEARDCPREDDLDLDPVEDYAALGLRLRPEPAEAKLRIEQGRLEIIKTRSGMLPRLDLFVTLGKTGYADSFGGSFSDLTDSSGYETAAGLRFEWTLGNRKARATGARAEAGRAQAAAALDNLTQLIIEDIYIAHLEAQRARAQIEASAERRRLQEEVVRAEEAKFNVGRGTALAVAQAQRDLLESRLDEINTLIRYRQARIALYRLDGSLLMRRGIEME